MNEQITEDLEWVAVSDLKAGEFFTLGTTCPLTLVSRGTYVTARGTTEVEASCLAGMRDGRAYSKTFYKPKLEVLIVPDEHVGARVGAAIEAFRDRNFRGCERVESATDIWPRSADTLDAVEDRAGVEVCS